MIVSIFKFFEQKRQFERYDHNLSDVTFQDPSRIDDLSSYFSSMLALVHNDT